MRHNGIIVASAAACVLVSAGPRVPAAPAGAFNLRIVSDAVPDFSSAANFAYSALSRWETDSDKALAQFRWCHRCRRTGPAVREDGRPVLDPVLLFNSYGMCGLEDIAAVECALWEAWGRPGRLVDRPGRVMAEVFYDGAWHEFDHASPGDAVNMAAPRKTRIQPDDARPRPAIVGSQAGHRYVLGVRPNERYTRYWQPLGTGPLYARLLPDGEDAAGSGSPLRNSRANGLWVWEPDLSDGSALFLSQNVKHTGEGIVVRDEAGPAIAVFLVSAANVVTSVGIQVQAEGSLLLRVSTDGGTSWQLLQAAAPLGVAPQGVRTELPAGRLQYLLRADLAPGAVLRKLRIETITQVNPRALPRLRQGSNTIVAVSDEHLETIVLQPRLTAIELPGEVLRAQGWQIIENPSHREPTLRATGKAELVLRAVAPRRIRRIRAACTALMTGPAAELSLALSYDGGRDWLQIGRYGAAAAPYDRRLQAEAGNIPGGCREVLIRYAYGTGGSGLANVVAEAVYETAGGFMPYDITYAWDEYHHGEWVERYHRERVEDTYHKYRISVDGTRPPIVNWVRVEPAGEAAAGYDDGVDAGDRENTSDYLLSYGRLLSAGCGYEVSRRPSRAYPDVGRRLLTDGFIARPDVQGLRDVNLSGPGNEERVGEIVVWEPGGEADVILDLGKPQTVGGACVTALQPSQAIPFPSVMQVETSLDRKAYELAGLASWEDCFRPPGDELRWEGWDSPAYDHLPAGGRLVYRFPVEFVKPRPARFVRFRLLPAGEKAGMALSEVQVFDRLDRKPWDERIALPAPR